MGLEGWRDLVLSVAMLLAILQALLVGVLFAILWWYTRKLFRRMNRAVQVTVRPTIADLHGRMTAVRDRTSYLPGNAPLPEGQARQVTRRSTRGSLLSRARKRRPWLPGR